MSETRQYDECEKQGERSSETPLHVAHFRAVDVQLSQTFKHFSIQ